VNAEQLISLKQFPGSPEWKPSGDNWPVLQCVSEDKSWSATPVLFAKLGTVCYLFRTRIPLGPDAMEGIAPYAQKYGHSNGGHPIPGSVTIPYGGVQFAIQDIGTWQIKSDTGESHFPGSDRVAFLIAHGPENHAILIENDQSGSKFDSVWRGMVIEDFDRVVREVLEPDGK